jgi:peptide/nickel transport system substrate-binding protein
VRVWLTAFLCAVLSACAPAAQKPNTDNVLAIGIALEPPGLDPTAGAAAAIDEVVYANVFEGLTRIGPNGEVKPALARDWTIANGGRTYVFHLQPDVKFHDGAAFTAEDVAFSLDRARGQDSKNAQKEFFEPIEKVTALDPLTVEVRLKRPVGDFLFNMGVGDSVIVDPASAATNAVNPIGTGPFKFARWQKGVAINLVRNPSYWGAPISLDGARFVIVPDPSAAFAALLAGDVQGFPDFPAPELLTLIAKDRRFRIAIGTTEGETILAINNQRAPFTDRRVREAIALAIDRKALIDGAMFGYGVPIGSHFAPHNAAYVDLTGLSPHDPARARELLKEAGYADGFTASLRLPPVGYARRGGEIIAAQLAQVGIETKIENIEWAQWLEQVFANRDFDLTIVSHTEANDIGIYARKDYYFGYRNPTFDSLIDKLNATIDEKERRVLLQQAQRIIAADYVNGYLFQLAKIGVWDARIEGQWKNSPVQANDLTAVRIAAAAP